MLAEQQCFHMMAYPERRCPNVGRWVSLNAHLGVKDWVWCDEHRFPGDLLIVVDANDVGDREAVK